MKPMKDFERQLTGDQVLASLPASDARRASTPSAYLKTTARAAIRPITFSRTALMLTVGRP